MPKRERGKRVANLADELLKKLLIVQLSIARVPQREIAKILGISLTSVNSIAKYVKLPND